MRDKITEVRANHDAFLAFYFGVDPQKYIADFMERADFLPSIRAYAPDLLEEVEGLAEGADLSFDEAFHMQLIDEEWAYGFYHHRAVEQNKCTALGARNRDGLPTVAGQNVDVPAYIDGAQVLLTLEDERTGELSYVFSYAGLIGLMGMNDAPLGICCNTINQLETSMTGLPVAFIVRCILQCRSFDEAQNFIARVPHASGQNYLLSSPNQVGTYECSANNVTEFHADADGQHVYHTNHALVNDDQKSYRGLLDGLSVTSSNKFANSRARLDSIAERMVAADGAMTVEKAKAALRSRDNRDHPICRSRADTQDSFIGFTAASLIYEYADEPCLHLASGPPDETVYHVFDFKRKSLNND